MKSFLEDALRSSCEGIMVKSLDIDAGYFPSKRTDGWLKVWFYLFIFIKIKGWLVTGWTDDALQVKKDYVEGLNDSLDLVPIGAWHGNGRKAG